MTGSARGRYCPPKICWCGGCAWWKPAPEPDYRRLREAAERAAVKLRRSWAQRDDPTWFDEL